MLRLAICMSPAAGCALTVVIKSASSSSMVAL